MLERVYKSLAKPFGFEKPSKELKEAVNILGWDLKGWEIISASTWIMIISSIVLIPFIILLFFNSNLISGLLLLFVPLILYYLFSEYPKYLSRIKISNMIGEIPVFMTQLVLLLKNNSNIESALEFLSNEKGYIYNQIKDGLWELKEGRLKNGEEILLNISNKWERYFIDFKRSIDLLLSSIKEKNRENLDKSLQICINGLNEKFEEYSQSLTLPTMILFSIGTIIPLVTITMFPIISFFNFNSIFLFIIFSISLIFLYIYSNEIISKRPFSFGEFKIKLENINYYWGILIFLIISIPSIIYLFNYIPGIKMYILPEGYNLIWIVVGFGFSLSALLYLISYKARIEKINLDKVESNVSIVGYKLSTIVGEGKPIDESIKKLNDDTPRIILLKHLVSLMKDKGTKRLHELLIRFSDYFSMIDKIKFSLMMRLHNTIQMMKLTAVIFIPLVAGLSSGLALIMKNNMSHVNFFSYNVNVEIITLSSGLYSILLLLLLIRYVVYLRNGVDKINFYYESSKYIPTALFIFILSFVMVSKVIS